MRVLKLLGLTVLALALVVGVLAALLGVRHAQTVARVDAEWQTVQVPRLTNLGGTRSLEIVPLVDELSNGAGLQSEHGVSYLVKTDTATILFDVGQNARATNPSPLEANMQSLGVSVADIDTVVISHDHPDHTGGQRWWRAGTLSFGNEQADLADKAVYVPTPLSYPGMNPVVATLPRKIAEGVATLGTIPFAESWPMSLFRSRNLEQALAVSLEGRGVVIISGCGHQTVARLLERARALFDAPIVGLVGGLHYGNQGRAALEPDVRLLHDLPLEVLALSPHDTEAAARSAVQAAFPKVYQDVTVGQPLRFTAIMARHEVSGQHGR